MPNKNMNKNKKININPVGSRPAWTFKKGQSILEYIVIFSVVVASVLFAFGSGKGKAAIESTMDSFAGSVVGSM